jgi:hypothetical protein
MRNCEVKRKIVEAATYLFSVNGYHKVSINEIAKLSKRAKGTIYYHFESKESIFVDVVTSEIERVKKSLLVIISDPSLPADVKLKRFLLYRMHLLNEANSFKEALRNNFFKEFEQLRIVRRDFDHWMSEQYISILKYGSDEDVFIKLSNPKTFVDLYVLMQKGLEKPFFLEQKYDEYIFQYKEILTLLVNGVKNHDKKEKKSMLI